MNDGENGPNDDFHDDNFNEDDTIVGSTANAVSNEFSDSPVKISRREKVHFDQPNESIWKQ